MPRFRLLLFYVGIGGLLLACGLLPERLVQEQVASPSGAATQLSVLPSATPEPMKPPVTVSPSPLPMATAQSTCILVAKDRLVVYRRPSREADLSAILPPGTQIQALYRTADGWYGFDPGPVIPEDKRGLARIRWVAANDVEIQGDCGQLTLVPSPPAHTCLAGIEGLAVIRPRPDDSEHELGFLEEDDLAIVVARDPGGEWLKVRLPDEHTEGWLNAYDVSLDGPCKDLPLMAPDQAEISPTPQSTPTAQVLLQGHQARILFAPGAVAWERPLIPGVEDYVFQAASGQTVGIAVVRGGTFVPVTLALQAPDGKPLLSLQEGRDNWHGLLLQDGDYHLTVKAQGFLEGAVLQIHAYPPLAQHQQLADPDLGYTLFYDPTVFGPGPGWAGEEWDEKTGVRAQCLDVIAPEFVQNTDLSEARVCIGPLRIPQSDQPEEACFQTTVPYEGVNKEDKGTWWVNGVAYRFKHTGEGAAGQAYGMDVFYTYVNGRCVAVSFFTHFGSIGEYERSLGAHECDWEKLWGAFERLFFTLRWPHLHP